MRRFALIACVGGALAMPMTCAAPALGADAAAHEFETDNAALLYLRYAALVPEEFDWKPGDALTPEHIAVLESISGDVLEGAVRASRLPTCDFGIEYDRGIYTLLPHLSPMRRMGKLLCADAVRLSQAGDAAGAAERLGAVVRMSRHLGEDRVLISSLVGMAMLNMDADVAERIDAGGGFDDAARARVLEAFGAVDQKDLCGVESSIDCEGRVMREWLTKDFIGPDAGRKAAEVLGGEGSDATPAQLDALRALDGAGVRREAIKYQRYSEDVLKAWRSDDPPARLAELYGRAKDGQSYGVIAPLMGLDGVKVYKSASTCLERLDHVQKALAR